jgi:hypothetical protein
MNAPRSKDVGVVAAFYSGTGPVQAKSQKMAMSGQASAD